MTDHVSQVEQAICLRIYLGEDARVPDDAAAATGQKGPAWQAIVHDLRGHAVWGATALRGIGGYGPHGEIHHVRHIATRGESLPIVIEAIDRADKILPLLPRLARLAPDALFVTFAVAVHTHLHGDTP